MIGINVYSSLLEFRPLASLTSLYFLWILGQMFHTNPECNIIKPCCRKLVLVVKMPFWYLISIFWTMGSNCSLQHWWNRIILSRLLAMTSEVLHSVLRLDAMCIIVWTACVLFRGQLECATCPLFLLRQFIFLKECTYLLQRRCSNKIFCCSNLHV